MEKYMENNNIKKGRLIILEEFKIKFKGLFEYKINILMGFLVMFGFFLSSIFFVEMFFLNFADTLLWNRNEMYLFTIYALTISHFHFSFTIRGDLGRWIKQGLLSIYLTKPTNPFLIFTVKEIGRVGLFNFVILTPIFLITSIFFLNYSVIDMLILYFFGILNLIPLIILMQWITSFAFLIIEVANLKSSYLFSINGFFEKYPVLSISNDFTRFILLAGFSILYLQVILSLYFGTIYFNEIKIFFILYWLIGLLSVFGIYINWKIGLKRYEAFG